MNVKINIVYGRCMKSFHHNFTSEKIKEKVSEKKSTSLFIKIWFMASCQRQHLMAQNPSRSNFFSARHQACNRRHSFS